MAALPPDSRYVTGEVPPEMRDGLGGAEDVVAQPTAREIVDLDGTPTQLTQFKVPRPPHIPAGPPRVPPGFELPATPYNAQPAGSLQYDFPLFPAVQCRVTLQGEATADHLEQLLDYISVACKRLREQEMRDANRPKRERAPERVEGVDAAPKRKRRGVPQPDQRPKQ